MKDLLLKVITISILIFIIYKFFNNIKVKEEPFQNMNEDIVNAIDRENTANLEKYVSSNIINLVDESGMTFLNYAFKEHKKHSFQWLLNHNADPNIQIIHQGVYKSYLINLATKEEDDFYFNLLLNNANLNSKDYKGNSSIHNAIRTARFDRIYKLIESGADINITDSHHQTPAFFLCQLGNYEETYKILKKGAKVNIPDDGGFDINFLISNDKVPEKSKAFFWQQKIKTEYLKQN